MTPRRAPNFSAFILTGAILGFLLASAAVFVGETDPRYTFDSTLGYFAVLGALLGALAGGVVAALLDRRR